LVLLADKRLGEGGGLLLNSKLGDRLRVQQGSGKTAIGRFAARQALFGADKAKRGSFDFRATGVGGVLGGALGAGRAVKKKDRQSIEDEAKKREVKKSKVLERTDREANEDEKFKDLENREKVIVEDIKKLEEEQKILGEVIKAGAAADGDRERLRVVKDEIESRKTSQSKLKKLSEARLKEVKQAPRLAYAESLAPKAGEKETGGAKILRFIRGAGLDVNTRREAVRVAIEKDLKKGKEDRQLEALKKAMGVGSDGGDKKGDDEEKKE